MTLASTLWVTSPGVDTEQLWHIGRALIHRFSDPNLGPAKFEDKAASVIWEWREGTRERSHIIGQGFCSMYDLYFHPDGNQVQDGTFEHSKYCAIDESGTCLENHELDRLPWYQQISLDTSYGFQLRLANYQVWSAGDLHAAIMGIIGLWLTEQGATWSWYNEFTGEVNEGPDKLDELGRGGKEAANWFEGVVKPALRAEHPEIVFTN